MVGRNYFHLHLVSDATGETLIAVSRAAAAQYQGVSSIEHVYPLLRNQSQLEKAIAEIKAAPGIVLFTLVDPDLTSQLQEACQQSGCPCLSVLEPILGLFQSYLGTASTPRPGAQHMLNSDYFKRIDALNFTMMCDDGQQPEHLEQRPLLGPHARERRRQGGPARQAPGGRHAAQRAVHRALGDAPQVRSQAVERRRRGAVDRVPRRVGVEQPRGVG